MKPQPIKGKRKRHRMIFQFLVSLEISPYHCFERKFWKNTGGKKYINHWTVVNGSDPDVPPLRSSRIMVGIQRKCSEGPDSPFLWLRSAKQLWLTLPR